MTLSIFTGKIVDADEIVCTTTVLTVADDDKRVKKYEPE